MVQLSRNPIHKDVYYSIRNDFLWVIADIHSSETAKSFFYDFFTKTERVMFSKRLAIALMLRRGFDYSQIHEVLHVSTSTITSVARLLDTGKSGIVSVLDHMIKQEKMDAFWTQVDDVLSKISRLRK